MVHSPVAPHPPVACFPQSRQHPIICLWVSSQDCLPSPVFCPLGSFASYSLLEEDKDPHQASPCAGSKLTRLFFCGRGSLCIHPPSLWLPYWAFSAALPCLYGTCPLLVNSMEFQSLRWAILFFQLSTPLDPVPEFSADLATSAFLYCIQIYRALTWSVVTILQSSHKGSHLSNWNIALVNNLSSFYHPLYFLTPSKLPLYFQFPKDTLSF